MAPKFPIYLDHAATTPCDPRVVEAMLPYFTQVFGNPGSRNHQFGWEAEKGVDLARERCAALLGADEKEVVYTSGSTESNNIAIKGAAMMYEKNAAGNDSGPVVPRTAGGRCGHQAAPLRDLTIDQRPSVHLRRTPRPDGLPGRAQAH